MKLPPTKETTETIVSAIADIKKEKSKTSDRNENTGKHRKIVKKMSANHGQKLEIREMQR